ncbi:MAG: hypothetical protein ACJAX1_001029 [Neolewinella sp.]
MAWKEVRFYDGVGGKVMFYVAGRVMVVST